jgi:hypothetical protein
MVEWGEKHLPGTYSMEEIRAMAQEYNKSRA